MIRLAGMGDIDSLAALFKELHEHHVRIKPETFRMPDDSWFYGRILEILNDSETSIFVSDSGTEINGYAVVKILDIQTEEKYPRRVCYVDCFAVAENAGRQGVGTQLFERVRNFALEQECGSIQLGVSACNKGAVEFYGKMGLTPRTIQMELKLQDKEI